MSYSGATEVTVFWSVGFRPYGVEHKIAQPAMAGIAFVALVPDLDEFQFRIEGSASTLMASLMDNRNVRCVTAEAAVSLNC